MGSNAQAPKTSGEISMGNHNMGSDVVITMGVDEEDSKLTIPDASKDQNCDSQHIFSTNSALRSQKSVRLNNPSHETAKISSSPNRPPKIPKCQTLTRRKSLSRSVYSKPKSRFGEQSIPVDSKMFETAESIASSSTRIDDNGFDVIETNRSVPVSPKSPSVSSARGFHDENEEIYKKVSSIRKLKSRKVKAKAFIEWFLFLCILGCLIINLTMDKLGNWRIWGLKIWKWCLLVLVTFSGLFVTKWLMHFLVLVIELNFLLKKKVLYFVYGLRKSVRTCIWLALVLFTWVWILQERVTQSHLVSRILDVITWTIASSLIGSFLWLLKNLLLKTLASSFHVNNFFDRIQEAIFHQYILLSLSGPPVMEGEDIRVKTISNISRLSSGKEKDSKKKNKEVIVDMNELHQMKQDKVSAWTMKMLVDMISNSGLTTLSNVIDESAYDGGNEQADKEITNEEEAIAAAYYIFSNVAQPGRKYIDEMDMSRFMIKEEVQIVFPMINMTDSGQIDIKTLTEWVVKVYKGRKALAHALNDTKTAGKQLNKLVTVILVIVMIIVWLLLTGIATTKVLVFISSQLILAVFVFGNTCKTIFEAIIFVFVMHPFDVGDRCVIDGVQMIVEEMNILTTIFLKFDNEKIYYPNAVLATKPISNFNRSPDMGDSFEFSISFSTPLEKIGNLKEKIKSYLETNPQIWRPNHSVVVKEIENVNKLKMALFFNHTMNFQDMAEKLRRKTGLVMEMKKIFEELNIGYDLLPQEVHLLQTQH